MKLYTIFYKVNTYNPYKTYPQNQDRYVRSIAIKGTEEAYKKAKEIEEKYANIGAKVTGIYDAIGKNIYRK